MCKKIIWDTETCLRLNARQHDPYRHPYTCGNKSSHTLLIATPYGWQCVDCEYTQTWALDNDKLPKTKDISNMNALGLSIEQTEPVMHIVDALTNTDYPIRILEAHLHNNKACTWKSETGNKQIEEFCEELEKVRKKRCNLLERAIRILKTQNETDLAKLENRQP